MTRDSKIHKHNDLEAWYTPTGRLWNVKKGGKQKFHLRTLKKC
jgi:hypothetical protein